MRGYTQNSTVFLCDRVLPYQLFLSRCGTPNGTELAFNADLSDKEIVNSY